MSSRKRRRVVAERRSIVDVLPAAVLNICTAEFATFDELLYPLPMVCKDFRDLAHRKRDNRAAPIVEMAAMMPELRRGFLPEGEVVDEHSVVGALCALLLDCGSCRMDVAVGCVPPDHLALVMCAWGQNAPLRIFVPTTSGAGQLSRWFAFTLETRKFVPLDDFLEDTAAADRKSTSTFRTVSVCYGTESGCIQAVDEQPFHALLARGEFKISLDTVVTVWPRVPKVLISRYDGFASSFAWKGTDHQNRRWTRVHAFMFAKWTRGETKGETKGGTPFQTPASMRPVGQS